MNTKITRWIGGILLTGNLFFNSCHKEQSLNPIIEKSTPVTIYDFIFKEDDLRLVGKFTDKFGYSFDLYDTNGGLFGRGNLNDDRFISLYIGNSRRHFHRGDNPSGSFVSWDGGKIELKKGSFTLENIVEENPDQ